jgi:hypothetical protein
MRQHFADDIGIGPRRMIRSSIAMAHRLLARRCVQLGPELREMQTTLRSLMPSAFAMRRLV